MCIVYVDDNIFWEKIEMTFMTCKWNLRELCVDLEQYDDAAVFLGVTLEQDINT